MTFEYFDGTKSVPINQLPEEAWRAFRGKMDPKGKDIDIKDKVGWLKRCLLFRAEALAAMPWAIRDLSGKELWTSGSKEVPDNLRWLENLEDMLWLTEMSLMMNAEAFWQIEQGFSLLDYSLQPIGLKWLAASTMSPIWDPYAGLVKFERNLGGEPITFSTDEIVYVWIPDANHETMPDEPILTAAARSGSVLYNVDEFICQFFARGAVKATLLTVDKSAPQTEKDRVRDWWAKVMSGISNAWKTQVVSSAVEPIVIGDGIKELNNNELTVERREDIATTLGIPHSLVLSNSANYATADVDRRNFYVNTVIPSSRLIAKQINRQLFRPRGLSLAFKPDSMSIFQVDEQDRSISYLNYVRAGMKPSVAAQILGITLPANYEYEMLDTDFNDVQMATQDPQTAPKKPGAVPSVKHLEEEERFKRWAIKRFNDTGFSIDSFSSPILSRQDKLMLMSEVETNAKN